MYGLIEDNEPGTGPDTNLLDMVIETAARTAHEANRAWCEFNGDHSQVSWDEAPKWQKTSAIIGVNFLLANPNAPESMTHDVWMSVKLSEGWTYSPVKDADAKTHPCMVPFSALPPHQQFKDCLFRMIVLTILKGMNLVQQ